MNRAERLAGALALWMAAVCELALAQATPDMPWRILVLNGTDPSLPAFVAIDRGMRDVLEAPSARRVELYAETLDAMRFPNNEVEPELLALLARKYADRHIDAVVAVAPVALAFAEKHRARLWPEARIVYHSVPDQVLARMALSPDTRGVPIRLALAETVELALKLRPGTRRVVVISGVGDYDRMMTSLARADLQRFAGRVEVTYWLDRTVADMTAEVASIPSDTIILYLTVYRDAAGNVFVPRDAMQRMAEVSSVPIFGVVETYLGWGIAAGRVDSLELRGQRVAELIQATLSGPGEERIRNTDTIRCLADARQLARHGMSEADLPAGCEARFRSSSLWRDYPWQVTGASVLLLAQAGLVLALYLQRRRRRLAELEAQRRRMEAMHASRLALVGELSATIAHEINQPLGAILSNADAAEMLMDANPPRLDEVRRILADIRRDDQRASDVIRNVRSLARKRSLEFVPVDADRLLEEVADLIRPEAVRRDIEVRVRPSAHGRAVLGDPVHLQQVLLALTLNAKEAMSEPGIARRILTLSNSPLRDGRIAFIVSDTGGGIDPAVAASLFDSFVTTKREGIGLGLSIARTIVEVHDGEIEGRNAEGGGATFTVILPCAPADSGAGQHTRPLP